VVVQEQEGIDLVQAGAGHRTAGGQVADVVAMGGVQAKDGTGLGHSLHIGWRIGGGEISLDGSP
jgi:hypothetical protein